MDKVTQAVEELKELVPWLLKDPAGVGILVALGIITVSAIVFLYLSFATSASSKSRSMQGRVALNKDEWRTFKLIKKEIVTHDTRRFVFALPSPDMVLGLPIGQHVLVRGRDADGKEFSRPYTPTSLDSDLGILELVVKVYPSGKMSQFLDKVQVGEGVEFKGPKGRFKYEPGMIDSFGMIAGGSGITPMYQVVQAILKNPKDRTKCYLLFANNTEDDILLKNELDEYASKYPEQFKVRYFLLRHPDGWKGGVGFIGRKDIEEFLPGPNKKTTALVCGPLPMTKAMGEHLDAVGYSPDQQFRF